MFYKNHYLRKPHQLKDDHNIWICETFTMLPFCPLFVLADDADAAIASLKNLIDGV